MTKVSETIDEKIAKALEEIAKNPYVAWDDACRVGKPIEV
jgi:hypothetical protein